MLFGSPETAGKSFKICFSYCLRPIKTKTEPNKITSPSTVESFKLISFDTNPAKNHKTQTKMPQPLLITDVMIMERRPFSSASNVPAMIPMLP